MSTDRNIHTDDHNGLSRSGNQLSSRWPILEQRSKKGFRPDLRHALGRPCRRARACVQPARPFRIRDHLRLVAFGLCLCLANRTLATEVVDLELVLAVDASGSVDDEEFALQMRGIAAGFRDRQVQRVIRSGPLGRIAVAVALWSDPQVPKSITPWFVIGSREQSEAFAGMIERHPRDIPAGSTGIGEALHFAKRQIEGNGIDARRKVIDLSGDGRETAPRDFVVLIWQGRFVAMSAGITVNGLAILNDEPNLDRYYRRELIAGENSFVTVARSYGDFADAMRRKLLREIEHRPKVGSVSPPGYGFAELAREGQGEVALNARRAFAP